MRLAIQIGRWNGSDYDEYTDAQNAVGVTACPGCDQLVPLIQSTTGVLNRRHGNENMQGNPDHHQHDDYPNKANNEVAGSDHLSGTEDF